MELSEDFKSGMIHNFQIETIQQTILSSRKAERIDGVITSLSDGYYSPYLNLSEGLTPPWRIRATEINFNHDLQTINFINSTFEVFGFPIFVIPNFSVADPSVTNKSGFLKPKFFSDERLGYGFAIPYYFAAYPYRDFTVTSAMLSNQGLILGGELRQRLERGGYTLRGSGINQSNPEIFKESIGNRQYRGAVNFSGGFGINRHWSGGWDLNAYSDPRFVPDYAITTLGAYGSIQRLWLNGYSNRNSFEAQIIGFEEFVEPEMDIFEPTPNSPFPLIGDFLQEKQPFVHPVLDYQYFLKNSVFGGVNYLLEAT